MLCQLEDISLLATLKFEYKYSFMLCYSSDNVFFFQY